MANGPGPCRPEAGLRPCQTVATGLSAEAGSGGKIGWMFVLSVGFALEAADLISQPPQVRRI
jgi:hypothetical protein